ncbi:MAG: hypothetical protein JST90_15815 [Bacteroidetes bacterium]|nr:hypothetical protein [Bacteroidota bacterium]
MNLLFVFLKNVRDPERSKLATIQPRGTMGIVWDLINKQTELPEIDKQKILSCSGITVAHLDKITSELLGKCYHAIFSDDEIALLDYLCSRVSMNKLFYAALPRFLKQKAASGDITQNMIFIKKVLDMIQDNMPLVYREEKTLKDLSEKYIALHTGKAKSDAAYFISCRQLLYDMEHLFASLEFNERKEEIRQRLDTLSTPDPAYSITSRLEYYKVRLYFYQAAYEHEEGLAFAQNALKSIPGEADPENERNILRIELKINEFMYFTSRFDGAFERYHRLMTAPSTRDIPDFFYHQTKYLQLAMITAQMDAAAVVFDRLFADYGSRTKELMLVRDVITYVKFCILNGDYDRAFEFLQLGFEKNFKATYFQYELELRNLQVAYFYLSGQQDVALENCRKHVKFLRNNGYTSTNSTYPGYYTLIKAFFDSRGEKALSARCQKIYDTYQKGSYAIYGMLLDRMQRMR